MSILDLSVIVLYMVGTLGLGLWVSRRQQSATDYFLGARDLPAWSILLSIVATETSALTVISTPGLGATGDLGFLQLPIGYLIGRIGVSIWLLPGYFRGEQQTAYTRLEARFGVTTRRTLSLIFLVTRFLGDGVRVFAGAIPLAVLTGWDVRASIATMGVLTLIYTWLGGIKAVIWTDVIQWLVYIVGGIGALMVAWHLGGGVSHSLSVANAAGKLHLFTFQPSLTVPYTFFGGLLGGAMLSAASHGTDHLIVQRLLATRSLRDARLALVGSGIVVIFQFALFLLIGVALWSARLTPPGVPQDKYFVLFIIGHMPSGLAGLMIAGILAAAMSSHASAINSLASSFTHDQYASWTGERDSVKLLRVGKLVSLVWGLALIGAALGFQLLSGSSGTPVIVLALSIASVTYGALLGAYLLAGMGPRIMGVDVIRGAIVTMLIMLVTIFSAKLVVAGAAFLTPISKLAFPWYVPLGTGIMMIAAIASSRLHAAPAVAQA